MVSQNEFSLQTRRRGFHLITNENADPAVLDDMVSIFDPLESGDDLPF